MSPTAHVLAGVVCAGIFAYGLFAGTTGMRMWSARRSQEPIMYWTTQLLWAAFALGNGTLAVAPAQLGFLFRR